MTSEAAKEELAAAKEKLGNLLESIGKAIECGFFFGAYERLWVSKPNRTSLCKLRSAQRIARLNEEKEKEKDGKLLSLVENCATGIVENFMNSSEDEVSKERGMVPGNARKAKARGKIESLMQNLS